MRHIRPVAELQKELVTVTHRINDLALFQYDLPGKLYREQMHQLFESKRALLALLGAVEYVPMVQG